MGGGGGGGWHVKGLRPQTHPSGPHRQVMGTVGWPLQSSQKPAESHMRPGCRQASPALTRVASGQPVGLASVPSPLSSPLGWPKGSPVRPPQASSESEAAKTVARGGPLANVSLRIDPKRSAMNGPSPIPREIKPIRTMHVCRTVPRASWASHETPAVRRSKARTRSERRPRSRCCRSKRRCCPAR